MKLLRFSIILSFILAMAGQMFAQDEEVPFPEDYKRNVIKWNLTPFLLWDKRNINLSYERILKSHKSFSVNAGYFVLPSLIDVWDSLGFDNTREKSGFSVSGDYRWYFKKRNKNIAPDGLFWGVWGSYHHYQFTNDVRVLNNPDIQGDLRLAGK